MKRKAAEAKKELNSRKLAQNVCGPRPDPCWEWEEQ